ncbi:hypothetical protein LC040_03170 [Bacillus tianshenii]|nr:hypothetical protein LC040_03170 [Bacillus tianshenii]
MTTKDIRELAHQLVDELEDEELSEVIESIRRIKTHNHKLLSSKTRFPLEKPTLEELEAIKLARKELANGQSYSHEEVFGEDDYV